MGWLSLSFCSSTFAQDSISGLQKAHKSAIDPNNTDLVSDIQGLKTIGEVTALIPEASTADETSENAVDGQSGDTDFPFIGTMKALATVGEYDANTGMTLTGWPDGNAAWLVDEDTVRVAYQSESYSRMSSETYPWVMANGVSFTGSHIHTIDYNREKFADFLENGEAASEMVEGSGHLFDTVYNVFGEVVTETGKWGNQTLPDGTVVPFGSRDGYSFQLTEADFFFQSFCGSHFEQADRYGAGIGFADDVWLCGEEWNIQTMFSETRTETTDTMGLASIVVDIANETAYTVPALGQSGYEKLMPINPGHQDYVVIVCAGYNFDLPADAAPLKVYVGKKGVMADGSPVSQFASERDKFLARNGLLCGRLYGLAVANDDYAALGVTPDADSKRMDEYLLDASAPDTFSARYYPTSYQWTGFDNPVAVKDTEVYRWLHDGDNGEPDEQPAGYTFFSGDDKVEHPAVDPDITKFRYVQNMTEEGALLGIEFTNLVAELTATPGLPDYVSADVTRLVAAVDGALALQVDQKGVSHDGSTTAAVHVERGGVAKMVAPDGLHWIKGADGDVLIVDEDSGNDFGERKYAIVLDSDEFKLAEDNRGYFLALAGGNQSPRAANGVSAYGGTFSTRTSSEFSGSWSVTGLIARKENGDFYSQAELAGTGLQAVEQSVPLSEQALIGVVQHRTESGGSVANFRNDHGGQIMMFDLALPTPGLKEAHLSNIDAANEDFSSDVNATRTIGSVTAPMPEASTADETSESSVDGQPGDQDYPFLSNLKAIATVGEVDPQTGYPLTGWPDGNAAWLADNDTVRIAYQSESYATNSTETYPWVMKSGVEFTGSHIHTVDYDRAAFADFLHNDSAAAEMFKASDHLFDTVYNVFGEEVTPKTTDPSDLGGKWGNQTKPDGSIVEFRDGKTLSDADFFFQSFCGSHYEQAYRYGPGIGFEDDVWLNAEEWNIQSMFDAEDPTTETMGLASVVVDIANKTAYTVPALGQSGYEKLLPMNPGSSDYVVIICAGYNFDLPADTAPLKVYVGKKGVDENNVPVDQTGSASDRDKFLARNGLLYGKLYGMAISDSEYAALGMANAADPDAKRLDEYLLDAGAPDTFKVCYYPTSYQWAGFDEPKAVKDTEASLWLLDGDNGEGNEQPAGYTFFTGDDKVEHPAVDPDITKFRYIQNMTEEGALLGITFTNMISELTATSDLPEFLSADVRRIVPAVDGSLTLEVGDTGKGVSHDGTTTAAVHVERGVAKMVAPDGLYWVRSADADVLIVDEDSGNDFGERKYAIVLNPETLEQAEPGKGYFLALAGGAESPRAMNGVSSYGGTFQRLTSSEFSGSWSVTGLVARKEDGSFYSMEELGGTGMQAVTESLPLDEQVIMGVLQHRTESGGSLEDFRADRGGQVFVFGFKDINTQGGTLVFDLGTQGMQTDNVALTQTLRAGDVAMAPTIEALPGYTFVGWDQEFDSISGNTVVTAQYVKDSDINDFGLFTSNQLQALAGAPTVAKDANVELTLSLSLQRSEDLANFMPMPLNSTDHTLGIGANGEMELQFNDDSNAAFFYFEWEE